MDPNLFVATLLRTSAQGLAGLATGKLYEESEVLVAAPQEFGDWKAHLQRQVVELAAALESGSPVEFADHVVWIREAFEAREVPTTSLRASVLALQSVTEDSLPPEAARDLEPYFAAALARLEASGPVCDSLISGDGPERELARKYLDLILSGHGLEAHELIADELRSSRLSTPDAIEQVLTPAMREVGALWHRGRISAADEHYASTTTQRVLTRALDLSKRAEPNGRSVLVTSVAGDAHGLGVQVVASMFELDGWNSICLGVNTPPQDLLQGAMRFDVSLVAVGATLSTHRNAVASAIGALRAELPELPILVGGSAFGRSESSWRQVGANAFADSAREAVRVGRLLVGLDD